MFEIHPVERPYPGLRPFEPWESSIFSGREAHTDRLLEILQQHHLLVVTGPSGSGKSSLVRAGLLPALGLGSIGRGSGWRLAVMRPGDRPLQHLAQSLLSKDALGPQASLVSGHDEDPGRNLAYLHAELERGPRGLADWVADMRGHAVGPDFDLLLLVDQFEEIFTYAQAGATAANQSDRFVDLLLSAVQHKDSGVYVVLTMRTDFLGLCTRFAALPEAINHASFLTPRLSRAQLTRAITEPALAFGGQLDAALAGELVNAVHDDPDQLPVLQHALARMWDVRGATPAAAHTTPAALTLADLAAVGGIDEALSRHADDVLRTVQHSAPQSALQVHLQAQWLLRCLSEQRSAEAGGQLVRRPQTLRRIAHASGIEWTAFVPLLRAFAQPSVSFLTYAGQPGDPAQGADTVVDISHEALLRQWQQLKAWVGAEARAAAQLRELQRRVLLPGALLTGPDLTLTTAWLADGLGFTHDDGQPAGLAPTPAWVERYPAAASFADVQALHRKAVDEAQLQTRRARRLNWLLRSGVLLVFVMGIAAALFGTRAYQAGLDANAQALWHRLRFNDRSVYMRLGSAGGDEPDDEPGDTLVSALGEDTTQGLLTLARADRNIRKEVARKWLNDEVLARQLVYSQGLVLQAALGLDRGLRDDLLAAALKDADTAKGSLLSARAALVMQTAALDQATVVVRAIGGPQMDAMRPQIKAFAARLQGASAQAWAEQISGAMGGVTDLSILPLLGFALAAGPVGPGDIAARLVIAHLLQLLAERTEEDDLRFIRLGLRELARALSPAQAPLLIEPVLQFAVTHTEAAKVVNLPEILGPVAKQMTPAQVDRYAALMLDALARIDRRLRDTTRGQFLQALKSNASEAQAYALADGLVSALRAQDRDKADQESFDDSDNESLDNSVDGVLPELVAKLGPDHNRAIAFSLAAVLGGPVQGTQAYTLREALTTAVTKLNADDVQSLIAQMYTAHAKLRRPTWTNYNKLEQTLNSTAWAAMDKLTDKQADLALQLLLHSDDPISSQPGGARRAVITERITPFALVSSLLDKAAGAKALTSLDRTDRGALVRRFAVLSNRLTADEADILVARVIQRLNDPIARPTRDDALWFDLLAPLLQRAGTAETAYTVLGLLVKGERSRNYERKRFLAKMLGAAGARLTKAQALELLDTMLAEAARVDGPYWLLNDALPALALSRPGDELPAFSERLVQAIIESKAGREGLVVKGLLAVARTMSESQRAAFANRLLDVHDDVAASALVQASLAQAASLLSMNAITSPEQAARWVEFCKSPFADRAAVVAALRKFDPGGRAGPDDLADLAGAAERFGVDVRKSLQPAVTAAR